MFLTEGSDVDAQAFKRTRQRNAAPRQEQQILYFEWDNMTSTSLLPSCQHRSPLQDRRDEWAIRPLRTHLVRAFSYWKMEFYRGRWVDLALDRKYLVPRPASKRSRKKRQVI